MYCIWRRCLKIILSVLFVRTTVIGVRETIRLGIFLEGAMDDRLLWLVGDYVNKTHHSIVFDMERYANDSMLEALAKFSEQSDRSPTVQITLTSCETDSLLSLAYFHDGVRLVVTSEMCDVIEDLSARGPIFHISPPAIHMFSAIKSVLLHQDLNYGHVYIFFDDSTGIASVQGLVEWLTEQGAVSTTAYLSKDDLGGDGAEAAMEVQLAEVKESADHHDRVVYNFIVVLYRQANAQLLLKLALKYDLNSIHESWLVAGRDVRPEMMDLRRWSNRNLVFLTSDLRRVIKSRNCPFASNLIYNNSINFTNTAIYLADAVLLVLRAVDLSSTYNGSDGCLPTLEHGIEAVLRSMTFTGLTDGVQFDSLGYNKLGIYDILRVEPESSNTTEVRLAYVGNWTQAHGLQVPPGVIFRNHFTNFENQTLRISMIVTPPFVMTRFNMSAKNNITHYGFCVDLIEELRSRLNFNYEVVTPELHAVGKEISPGVWSGEIGMVLRGEADMVAGPVTITMERSRVVDFTTVFMEDDNSIILKKPGGDKSPLDKIFEPFHPHVWAAICVSVVVFSLFLALANYVSRWAGVGEGGGGGEDRGVLEEEDCTYGAVTPETRRNLAESTWCMLAHIFGQSAIHYPTTVSGRTLVVFWWVFTILISAYYTANLAAKLTAPMSAPHLESINQLAAQTAVKPLIKNSTSLEQLFSMSSPPSVYATLWSSLQPLEPFPVTNEEALSRVASSRGGGYAFMSDSSQLRYALSQNCDLYVLGKDTFYSGSFGLVVPKGAIYRDRVSLTITKMREAGLIDRLSQKYWPQNMCAVTSQTAYVTLDFSAVSGAYCACAALSIAAILTFVVERRCRYLLVTKPPKPEEGSSVPRREPEDVSIDRLTTRL